MLEFPKKQRLLRRLEFTQTMDAGTKTVMPYMVLMVRRTGDLTSRIGFIVSKKVGGSVERNSVKRRLREIYRTMTDKPVGTDWVVIARGPALGAEFTELEASFREGMRRALMALERREKPRAQTSSTGPLIIPISVRREGERPPIATSPQPDSL